jgi:hypothetical protein
MTFALLWFAVVWALVYRESRLPVPAPRDSDDETLRRHCWDGTESDRKAILRMAADEASAPLSRDA